MDRHCGILYCSADGPYAADSDHRREERVDTVRHRVRGRNNYRPGSNSKRQCDAYLRYSSHSNDIPVLGISSRNNQSSGDMEGHWPGDYQFVRALYRS